MPDIYLPKKNIDWNAPMTIEYPEDHTEYHDEYKKMNVLNEKQAIDAIYPKADKKRVFEYHHKDNSERHPETLYIVPGSPRHWSDGNAQNNC